MRILILKRAEKQLEKLPRLVQIAIIKKIREFTDEKTIIQKKKLSGFENLYRVRVGNYRILFTQLNDNIEIIAVQHRKDIYRS